MLFIRTVRRHFVVSCYSSTSPSPGAYSQHPSEHLSHPLSNRLNSSVVSSIPSSIPSQAFVLNHIDVLVYRQDRSSPHPRQLFDLVSSAPPLSDAKSIHADSILLRYQGYFRRFFVSTFRCSSGYITSARQSSRPAQLPPEAIKP